MNRATAVPQAGVVVAVRGSVVDMRFDGGLPAIHSLLRSGDGGRIAIEVLAQRDARHVRGIALNATPGIQAVGRLAGAGKAAQKAAGSRAVSTAVDDGVTFLGRSGRRQVGGFDELGDAAKKLADNRKAAISREGGTALANNATKRLTGPSKKQLTERDRKARAKKRRDEMTKENADRYGLDPKSSDYTDKAKAVRDNLGGSDFSLGMKKGGSVKGWGAARGARKAKII